MWKSSISLSLRLKSNLLYGATRQTVYVKGRYAHVAALQRTRRIACTCAVTENNVRRSRCQPHVAGRLNAPQEHFLALADQQGQNYFEQTLKEKCEYRWDGKIGKDSGNLTIPNRIVTLRTHKLRTKETRSEICRNDCQTSESEERLRQKDKFRCFGIGSTSAGETRPDQAVLKFTHELCS